MSDPDSPSDVDPLTALDPITARKPRENGYPPCGAWLITDFGRVVCLGVDGHETVTGGEPLHHGIDKVIGKTFTWDSEGEDADRMKYALGVFAPDRDLDGEGD